MIQICQMINNILYGFWHLRVLDKKHLHGISMLMAHFCMALGVELTLFLLFATNSLLLTIAHQSLLLLDFAAMTVWAFRVAQITAVAVLSGFLRSRLL